MLYTEVTLLFYITADMVIIDQLGCTISQKAANTMPVKHGSSTFPFPANEYKQASKFSDSFNAKDEVKRKANFLSDVFSHSQSNTSKTSVFGQTLRPNANKGTIILPRNCIS